MSSLIILINHSGKCDNKNNFMDYSIKRVLITTYIDFNGFIQLILILLTNESIFSDCIIVDFV